LKTIIEEKELLINELQSNADSKSQEYKEKVKRFQTIQDEEQLLLN